MPELIDKAIVLKHLTPRIKAETYYGEGYNRALEDAAELVTLMPTTEAEPVRRGRWIPVTNGRGGHECDQCRNYAPSYQTGEEHLSDYCPNCGADMREGGTDNDQVR